VTLRSGQRLVGGLQENMPSPVAIGTEPDWTRQLAVFNRAPLSDVVSAANRYSIDKIVIVDPAIARLRVSGTFRIVEAPRLCDKLAALFDLVVDRRTPGIIVLRRNPSK
jgi:ferric-dicitrate binding protein FerR (iron transport regulator)